MPKVELTVKLIFIALVELEDLVCGKLYYSHLALFNCRVIIVIGKNGIAINLVDSEKSMEICRAIENHFKKTIKELNADNTEEIEKIGS